MEEIRQAGLARYENMSSREKNEVLQMFTADDANRDGWISFQEVFNQFTNSMHHDNIVSLFRMIDMDGNGFLDFREFVTLYYVINSRPLCKRCWRIVTGLYFCCVRCWEMHVSSGRAAVQPYELCSDCYYSKSFIHEHQEFLDNFVLLRSMSKENTSKNKLPRNEASTPNAQPAQLLYEQEHHISVAIERSLGTQENRREEKALEAGRLYFRSLAGPELNVARSLFREMDQNGDGWVHSNEVILFLVRKGVPAAEAPRVFENMGMKHNSYLTLEEVVAIWYVVVMRPVCNCCKVMIMGSYYVCVACFHSSSNDGDPHTYDLCPGCYSTGIYYDQHQHRIFVDNYALLHLKGK